METLYLIRHGETALNAQRILQPPETPLSPLGRDQARRLAQRLARVGITRILSSDLARASMTAQALAEASGAPIEHDPLLQERNFGALRGIPYAKLGFDPFAPGYQPPGGESWECFGQRVAKAWQLVEAMAESTAGGLAVVTHGLVCRAFAFDHLGAGAEADADEMRARRWGNTSLTIATGPDPWRVQRLNCTAHLSDGPSADANGAPA